MIRTAGIIDCFELSRYPGRVFAWVSLKSVDVDVVAVDVFHPSRSNHKTKFVLRKPYCFRFVTSVYVFSHKVVLINLQFTFDDNDKKSIY